MLSVAGVDRPYRFWIYVDGVLDEKRECRHEQHDRWSHHVASGLCTNVHILKLVKITEANWNNPYPIPNYVNFHGLLPGSRRCELPLGPSRLWKMDD